nr:MAG: hypothetical protein [Sichuan forest noda-like virus 5]
MSRVSNVKEYIPKPSIARVVISRAAAKMRSIPFLLHLWLVRIFSILVGGLIDSFDIAYYSELIEKNISRSVDLRRLLSHPLRNLSVIHMSKTHTHRTAAMLRTSANIKLNEIVKDAGMIPYTVSMSSHDSGLGSRYFYMVKDLNVPFKHDAVPDNGVLLFTDVDYYVNVNKWLKLFKPILMYTFVPKFASYQGPDYSYFIKDDVVHYSVSGGAPYKHKIWDYTGDIISIIDDELNLLTFHVTQHEIDADPNRRFISLLPSAKVPYPYYTHLDYDDGIKRRQFTTADKNILYDHVTDNLSISTNGSPHCVNVKGQTFAALNIRLKNKSSPPVVADVERMLNQDKVPQSHALAPILFSLIDDIKFKNNIIPTSVLPCVFQTLKPLISEDGNNPGKPFSNTLNEQPSVFAARSFNNDTATIEGRVTKVKNTVTDPPRQYKKYLQEFVDFLVPDLEAGTGTPWALDQVFKVQNRPTQVARAKQVEVTLTTKAINKLKAFIKAEPYVSCNDPRNITTCSAELTTAMSCFTYAFKHALLKKLNWYGPGKTPRETVERIKEVGQDGGIASDVSRMDGSMSAFLHSFYLRSMMKWLHVDHRHEYMHWHRQTFTRKGATSNGVIYDAGDSTRSGSPITTDTNTVGACGVDYCANREYGMSPKEAWDALGIHTGDDGFRSNRPGFGPVLENTSRTLGLTYTTEVVSQGEPVTYCGRVFVDPSTSDDSFQDPKRTIPKLHLTCNKNVTDAQAATNKASGYIVTDSETPIIGTWARKVLEITKMTPKNITRDELVKLESPWPQEDKERIYDTLCGILNITSAEMDARIEAIENVQKLDEFPVLFDIQFKDKVEAQLGSEIVGPVPHVKENKTCLETKKPTNNNSTRNTMAGKSPVPSILRNKRRCRSTKHTRLDVKVRTSTAAPTLRRSLRLLTNSSKQSLESQQHQTARKMPK